MRLFEQLVQGHLQGRPRVLLPRLRGAHARRRAAQTIAGIDEPFVVVSHSLGTIIAYDVLREAGERELAGAAARHGRLAARRAGDPGPRRAARSRCPPACARGSTHPTSATSSRSTTTIRPEYAPSDRITDVMVANTAPTTTASASTWPRRPCATRSPRCSRARRRAARAPVEAGGRRGAAQPRARPPARVAAARGALRQPRALLRRLGGELRREPLRRTARWRRTARACCARTARVIADADGALELDFLRAGKYAGRQARSATTTGSTPARSRSRTPAARTLERRNRRRHLRPRRAAPRRRGLAAVVAVLLPQRQGHSGRPRRRRAARRRPAPGRLGARPARHPGRPGSAIGDPQPDVAVLAAHDYAHRIAWDERRPRAGDGGWVVYVGARLARDATRRPGAGAARSAGRSRSTCSTTTPTAAASRRRPEVRADPDRRARPGSAGRGCGAHEAEAGGRRRQPARAVAPGPVARPGRVRRGGVRLDGAPRARGRRRLEAAPRRRAPPAVTVGRDGARLDDHDRAARRDRGGMGGHADAGGERRPTGRCSGPTTSAPRARRRPPASPTLDAARASGESRQR